MTNISINQLLSIWTELEHAYHGTNKFGGNTAEIYANKLMPANAMYYLSEGPIGEDIKNEMGNRAALSLYHILIKFQETHECIIKINDRKLGSWLKSEILFHRDHIMIIPKQNKKR
jgi:hypothetical protein